MDFTEEKYKDELQIVNKLTGEPKRIDDSFWVMQLKPIYFKNLLMSLERACIDPKHVKINGVKPQEVDLKDMVQDITLDKIGDWFLFVRYAGHRIKNYSVIGLFHHMAIIYDSFSYPLRSKVHVYAPSPSKLTLAFETCRLENPSGAVDGRILGDEVSALNRKHEVTYKHALGFSSVGNYPFNYKFDYGDIEGSPEVMACRWWKENEKYESTEEQREYKKSNFAKSGNLVITKGGREFKVHNKCSKWQDMPPVELLYEKAPAEWGTFTDMEAMIEAIRNTRASAALRFMEFKDKQPSQASSSSASLFGDLDGSESTARSDISENKMLDFSQHLQKDLEAERAGHKQTIKELVNKHDRQMKQELQQFVTKETYDKLKLQYEDSDKQMNNLVNNAKTITDSLSTANAIQSAGAQETDVKMKLMATWLMDINPEMAEKHPEIFGALEIYNVDDMKSLAENAVHLEQQKQKLITGATNGLRSSICSDAEWLKDFSATEHNQLSKKIMNNQTTPNVLAIQQFTTVEEFKNRKRERDDALPSNDDEMNSDNEGTDYLIMIMKIRVETLQIQKYANAIPGMIFHKITYKQKYVVFEYDIESNTDKCRAHLKIGDKLIAATSAVVRVVLKQSEDFESKYPKLDVLPKADLRLVAGSNAGKVGDRDVVNEYLTSCYIMTDEGKVWPTIRSARRGEHVLPNKARRDLVILMVLVPEVVICAAESIAENTLDTGLRRDALKLMNFVKSTVQVSTDRVFLYNLGELSISELSTELAGYPIPPISNSLHRLLLDSLEAIKIPVGRISVADVKQAIVCLLADESRLSHAITRHKQKRTHGTMADYIRGGGSLLTFGACRNSLFRRKDLSVSLDHGRQTVLKSNYEYVRFISLKHDSMYQKYLNNNYVNYFSKRQIVQISELKSGQYGILCANSNRNLKFDKILNYNCAKLMNKSFFYYWNLEKILNIGLMCNILFTIWVGTQMTTTKYLFMCAKTAMYTKYVGLKRLLYLYLHYESHISRIELARVKTSEELSKDGTNQQQNCKRYFLISPIK